MNAISSGDTTN